MIERQAAKTLQNLAASFPVVAVTGPRQSGKTTLVKAFFPEKPYVSLEDLDQRDFAQTDPKGFLAHYPEGAILDEVQRCPDLFSYLQTLVDEDPRAGRFVLTGSQQFGLLSRITQSLAGRVGLLNLLPFSLGELQHADCAPNSLESLLFQGLYPPVYDRHPDPVLWYANYINTYVERDVRQLITVRDLSTFQRFLKSCAARTGQLLNLVSLANDCGISSDTAKAWLSVLEASYLIHLLPPHFKNFNKRLIKSPKLYFIDTGLAARLLGIQEASQLQAHPLRGELFETWVVSEFLKSRLSQGLGSNLFFWRDHVGHELDLLIETPLSLIPVEIKAGQTIASEALRGIQKWQALAGDLSGPGKIVYGGQESQLRQGIQIIPWDKLADID